MLYGIKAGDKHSLTDWSMYLMRGWGISPASENRYQVKVPGADGYKDLTKTLTGRVTYSRRTGTFPFKCSAEREAREAIYHEVMQSWHGKTLDIVTDAEPGYYYTGFMTVGAMTHLDHGFKCTVKADMEPFKWDIDITKYKCDVSFHSYFQIIPINGENVAKQDWNADLRFGTAEIPTHDFSIYSQLTVTATPTFSSMDPVLQFQDGDGNVYNATDIIKPVTGTGPVQWMVDISTLTGAGLDPSTIWRILISYGTDVVINGMAPGAIQKIVAGVRNKGLVITCPIDGVTMVYNGKTWPLPKGPNLITEFELEQGESTLLFELESVPLETTYINIEYRRGWL